MVKLVGISWVGNCAGLESSRGGLAKVPYDSVESFLGDFWSDVFYEEILLFFALLQNLLSFVLDGQDFFIEEFRANQMELFVSLDHDLSVEFLDDLDGLGFALSLDLDSVGFFLALRNRAGLEGFLVDVRLDEFSDFFSVPSWREIVNDQIEPRIFLAFFDGEIVDLEDLVLDSQFSLGSFL